MTDRDRLNIDDDLDLSGIKGPVSFFVVGFIMLLFMILFIVVDWFTDKLLSAWNWLTDKLR